MADRETLWAALSRNDLQGLYDHLGTMPWAPGSWSNHWRSALSEALHVLGQADCAPLKSDKPAAKLDLAIRAGWGRRMKPPPLDPSSDYAVARRLTAWAHQVGDATIRETVTEAADRFWAVIAERDALRSALDNATTFRTREALNRAQELLGRDHIPPGRGMVL